jgi:hypothetical protein
MKKFFVLLTAIILISSSCFATGAGFGTRSIAMGGTGIAACNDTNAAYFNPAGLMFGPENFQTNISAGGATGGLQDIIDLMSENENFITNQFENDITLSGSLNMGLGLSARKVGLGAFAHGFAVFDKPAFSLGDPIGSIKFNMLSVVQYEVPLTIGSSFTTPGLPIASLAVGVNLKSLGEMTYYSDVTAGHGTQAIAVGSGFGFDIGAQAKVTPLIMVGGVIRNLSASMDRTIKTKNIYVDPATGDITDEAEVQTKNSEAPAPEVGVGAAIIVPITGTLIAMDLENYSSPDLSDPDKINLKVKESYTDTHIGVEQGILFNLIMLRAGYYTDSPNQDTYITYGIGINGGPASLGLAASNSQKDFHNSMAMIELGLAF